MAVGVVVRLREGRYEAGGERRSDAEWPPHPARVFCALVAGARDDAEWAALRWLEAAAAPQVWAAPRDAVTREMRSNFVVTNDPTPGGGSQTHPARTNLLRVRATASGDTGRFAVVWPDAVPDAAVLRRLRRLAHRVPYVGRSSASAEVTVVDEVTREEAWTTFAPVTLRTANARALRVPYAGYVDALRAAYADGRRAWEVARSLPYAVPAAVGEPAAVASPFADLLIWGVERPSVPVSGDRLLQVTSRLREAVLSLVPDPVPPLVSGHGAVGRPHAAFLALPHVGSRHADGHLLGVAVAVPRGLEAGERRAVLRGLLDPPMRRLTLGTGGVVDLEYRPERTSPRGLLAERWTSRAGARRWTTATPVMLDRFPHRLDDLAALIADAVEIAGYPRPAHVEVLPRADIAGGLHRPRAGTLPGKRRPRPLAHARVEFAEPVVGPVIAGSLRYLGLGLLVPQDA